jgi:hypothetical protein
MLKRDTHIYCAVTAIVTVCVIVPEVAVIVRFEVVGVGVVVTGDCIDEEHPVTPASVIKSRRAKSDPRTMIDRRLRPANVSSPSGPINERLMPAREWNKRPVLWVIERS